MAITAKTEEGATILYGENIYVFEDGTRQVSEAERTELEKYMENGGPFKVTFEETKKKTDK